MPKLRLQHPLLLLLVTAFLAVQWSSAHIHQAAAHEHSGSHHQHHSTGHSHQLLQLSHSSHHSEAIDVASGNHNVNVVQLDHECHHPQNKKQDNAAFVALISTYSLLLPHPQEPQYSLSSSPPYSGYLTRRYHTPRGPPQLA